MRVFSDIELVEQLGTGIIRILKAYDKSVYEFSENFIRVNFKFKKYRQLEETLASVKASGKIEEQILSLIEQNPNITQKEMSTKLGISIRTLSRNIEQMKKNELIIRLGSDRSGIWVIK